MGNLQKNSQIKFKTTELNLNLCDDCDLYRPVKRTQTIVTSTKGVAEVQIMQHKKQHG